jgi:methionyl-tRNA synthetase
VKKYYLTTAIDYVNAKPHLGTAYEKIGADCLARYKRLAGFNTYFLIGTDEHSTNVEKEALRLGMNPRDYCDQMAAVFKKVWAGLNISYDQFIRTTDPVHENAVTEIFKKIADNGYIYQGTYKGYYCVSCEEFLVEKDLVEGKCPRHQQQPDWIEEQNYFFALSKFGEHLQRHIEDNPEFIRPESRRNEIMKVIESGLEDVSVSRAGKSWGVPLPGAEGQVIYVWFDALINYVSGLGFAGDKDENYKEYWPADCHIIGKDITRFHCLIWPAMLMAANIPLPKTIFGHGFVNMKGAKMSKTMGNILDPAALASFLHPDGLRYLLLREIAFNRDGDFSLEMSVTKYNAELANELGNLFSRTLSMVKRYRKGAVPAFSAESRKHLENLSADVYPRYNECMEELAFDEALDALWKVIQAANRYIEEQKPWELSRLPEKKPLDDVLRTLLEVLRMASIFCIPFMPQKAEEMRRQLALNPDLSSLRIDEANEPGDREWVDVGETTPLFPKLELPSSE